ncbi:Pentatricopeptide repeat-containing protein [Platanthera guangdongensis]|uniref:Pentatricopeptide repeat-containing protein n=1 Tax=Platanthera guangdongensis TaxID=2320717 RepID=A0ABR2LGL6_9ASPA
MLTKPRPRPYSSRRPLFSNLPLPLFTFTRSSPPCQLNPARQPRKPSNLRAFLNSQITQRGREGRVNEARSIFETMPFRDVISWTAMLTAYAHNGELSRARNVFDQMPKRNAAAWNAMISSYARDPKLLSESYELFCAMPIKNSVTYGAMIAGFARAGDISQAEEVYGRMPQCWRDPIGSNALISGYLRVGEIEKAEGLFKGMIFRDAFSWTLMVDGYCKKGMILDAREAFEAMPSKNVFSWTALIRGYIKVGCLEEGFWLLSRMRKSVHANSTTLSVLLDGCTELGGMREGSQLHGLVIAMGFEQDVFLANTLIVMYSRADCMDASRRIFDVMIVKDAVSWNSVIAGYVELDKIEEAYALFDSMPNKDAISWTSMVVGFSNRGWTRESVSLFETMPQKDEVGWTAVVSGLVRNGEHEIACQWFYKMARDGVRLNCLILSSMLSSMASLVKLKEGMQLHACAVKMRSESDAYMLSSLISMYSKCGNLSEACRSFSSIPTSNIICINSMITAFAQHGLAQEAFNLFTKIREDGSKPNDVTFLAILTACSRAGLVEEGNYYFKLMRSDYGIEPGHDHYTCMVDLLGRAGLLREALDLINALPDGPHAETWGAMLSASGLHSNSNLANLAARHLFELEPESAAPYAALSNIYANAGLKEDEHVLRMEKHYKGVKKNPGFSWLSMDGISINAPAQ